MKPFVIGAIVLCPLALSAQKATIQKIELAGAYVVVHYDLDDNNPNNEYQINLYASKDKYSAPLTKVSGDVGPEVKPGVGRTIRWNLLEEYGNYKGKLSLEVRGRVFVPFVKLRNFDAQKVYKRGKSYEVNWRPGNTNPIHIELYKGTQKVSGELNHPNNGKSTISIDSHTKPGKDYRLKITDSKKLDEVVYSDYFRIAPKIPFLVKLIPALGVAGGLAFVAGSGGGGGDNGGTTNIKEEIKDPPLPGGN